MTTVKFSCSCTPTDKATVSEVGPYIHVITRDGAAGVILTGEELVNFSTHMMTLAMAQMDPEDMRAFGNMMVESAEDQLPEKPATPQPSGMETIYSCYGVELTRDKQGFFKLDNSAECGGAYMNGPVPIYVARALIDNASVGDEYRLELAEDILREANGKAIPMLAKQPKEPRRRFSALSQQAQLIYQHMERAGSISARDAMADHGITSAALSRRICDIEAEGFKVNRDRRVHPITERSYTRYSLEG